MKIDMCTDEASNSRKSSELRRRTTEMYDREEMDAEAKMDDFTPDRRTLLKVMREMEAAKAVRRFGEDVRESIESSRTQKPPRFYNPLGVDEDKWRQMNRAERRKFIKENR